MNIYHLFLLLLILCVIGLSILVFWATRLETTTVSISNIHSVKFIHISDIHISHMLVSKKKLRRQISKLSPNFIILSGDYIDKFSQLPRFIKLIKYINPDNLPIYACLGNHDYHAFINESELFTLENNLDDENFKIFLETLALNGIELLRNSTINYKTNNTRVTIAGIDEYRYNAHNIDKTLTSTTDDIDIFIFHNPDLVLELHSYLEKNNKKTPSICLAGHFHGGQIWLPFNLEYKLLRNEKLCKRGITKGLHHIDNIPIYISRGLGCVLFPFRFFSTPEITLFKL